MHISDEHLKIIIFYYGNILNIRERSITMGYYTIKNLGDNIYSIFEMVGVGVNLIIGEDKALLIDTGYGFGNLRKEVKKLCQKPLIVVNSHAHADHCFGNSQFEQVYLSNADLSVLSTDALDKQYSLLMDYGMKMAPQLRFILLYAKLKRKPFFTTKLKEMPSNMEFELGNRKIKFMIIAGHTKGSMVALDEKSKTVFAGDAVNPGTFLFFERNLKLNDYAKQLEELSNIQGYDKLVISHSLEPMPFAFIKWYADFLRRVSLEKSKQTDFPNDGRVVWHYTENSEEYGECSVFYDEENL